MADLAAFKAILSRIDTTTSAIAEKIRKLVEQLQGGNLTAAEEEEVFADFTRVADQLDVLGQDQVPG